MNCVHFGLWIGVVIGIFIHKNDVVWPAIIGLVIGQIVYAITH